MVSIDELGIIGIPELIAGQKLIIPASIIFIFFFIAFAVELPSLAFSPNWLPDAHTDAPTAVSIMLAGATKDGRLWIIQNKSWVFSKKLMGSKFLIIQIS